MALPININELITGIIVESERLEFKRGWNKEAIIHSICAFANDFHNWGGGYIIVGVEENDGIPILPPIGIELNQIDKIYKELLSLCNRAIRPSYTPIVEHIVYMEQNILVIWANGGQNRPYKASKHLTLDNKEYLPYIRKFANTVVANQEEERELYNLASKIPFDDCINMQAKITDLKLPLIQSFLDEVKSDLLSESSHLAFNTICQRMALLDIHGETLYPRNVGILFFNDMPDKFIPYCQIDVVQFASDTKGSDKLIEKIFKGPIAQQIRDVLRFIQNVVIQEQITKLPHQAEAIRYFNYPFAALEEAVVNAVYHRDYQIREPIEISIFPNQINILSFPGPDRSIKLNDLHHGEIIARRYRNRRIGEFLKELKLTEGRSTGIPKIKRSLQINGSPEPIFDTDEDRSYFITTLKTHPNFLIKNHGVDDGVDDGVKDLKINETEQKILELIIQHELSKHEIISKMGYAALTKKIKLALSNLLKLQLIQYTIPNTPKNKNQKYTITELGKKHLNKVKINE